MEAKIAYDNLRTKEKRRAKFLSVFEFLESDFTFLALYGKFYCAR